MPAIGVITAIIGVFLTRPRPGENGLKTINRSFYLSAAISAVLVAIAAFAYLPSSFAALNVSGVQPGRIDDPRIVAIGAVIIGIVLAVLILSLTGYYTGTEDRPVKNVGKTSLTGAATVVLAGVSVGLESAVDISHRHRRARRRLGSAARASLVCLRSPSRGAAYSPRSV